MSQRSKFDLYVLVNKTKAEGLRRSYDIRLEGELNFVCHVIKVHGIVENNALPYSLKFKEIIFINVQYKLLLFF